MKHSTSLIPIIIVQVNICPNKNQISFLKHLKMKKMKKLNLLPVVALAAVVSFSSCKKEGCTDPKATNYNEKAKKDDGSCEYPTTTKEVVTVKGNLTGDVKWTKDKIYLLEGYVRVGRDETQSGPEQATGTLTIEAGTLIMGDRETKGTLIVHRGSKIIAEGTKDNPIIMTSERAPGLKEPGDWGGLVICGKAHNNNPGGTAEMEGQYGAFHGGGTSPINNDNSGIIRYVRIEYAGIPINPNQEVNSLTMGSVGSGTTIEYVMCSYGLDDAFEWFGGTVNCKNLIAYRGLDDDLDIDNGYSGRVQFALCIRDKSLADQSGSNGFEVDNDGSGSPATPFTSPTLSNVTIIGPKANRESPISLQYQHAAHLRRNNKIKIHNSFLTGYPYGFYVDGGGATANAQAGDLVIKNTIIAGVEHWGGNGYGGAGTVFTGAPSNGDQHPNNPRGAAFRSNVDSIAGAPFGAAGLAAWFNTPAFGNSSLAKWQDAGINASIFELSDKPTVLPNAGSILLSGANFSGLSGFESVTFRGAFGTTDWTEGWAEWNPGAVVYY
jgi:hypothetical protein